MADLFAPTYHRDGSVSVWDVWGQGWVRTSRPRDHVLASLDPEERERVIRHCSKGPKDG